MKTYRVWYKMTTYCYTDIKAEDEDEAEAIASNLDGAYFISTDDGDWEYSKTEEL